MIGHPLIRLSSTNDTPRDLACYGHLPPQTDWLGGARIALQFVLNLEEGGENCVLHGDGGSEQFLSAIIGAASYSARRRSRESIYEYGSRVGAWRLLGGFERRDLSLTVFGVVRTMQRNPALVSACLEKAHEIASHGRRWIHYQHIRAAVDCNHENPHRTDRCTAARLVHRVRQPEHAASRRRIRRL